MEGGERGYNLENIVHDLCRFFTRQVVDEMIPRLRDDILPYFSVFISNNADSEWKTVTAYKTCKAIYEQMGHGKFEVWENEIFKLIVTTFILVIAVDEKFSSVLIDKEAFIERYPEFLNHGDFVELDKLLRFRNCMALALKVVTPLKGKKHLLQLVHRMTRAPSDKEVLVTGGGMNDFVKRRVKIYEVEAGVTCRARAPRKSEINALFMESSSHFVAKAQALGPLGTTSSLPQPPLLPSGVDSSISPLALMIDTAVMESKIDFSNSPLGVTDISSVSSEIDSSIVKAPLVEVEAPQLHEIGNILLSLQRYVP